MDAKLIAKILPTKKDGGRTIGTGYPIGQDLVLTARHVLFPHWDDTGKIEVEWVDHNCLFSVTELVFDGGTECDIAIIRCKTPPQMQIPIGLLGQTMPSLHHRWDSLGYSRLGKSENSNSRVLVSALGEFHHPNGTHLINLTSKSDAKNKDNWKGLSGAPVFQNNILYAVITETPQDREECFSAVYIPWLLQNNQSFRDVVGLDENALMYQRFLEKQREQVKQYLVLIESSCFFRILGNKLLVQELKSSHLIERLFAEFDTSALALLDIALKASIEALNQEVDKVLVANQVKKLFFLLVSLMTPYSSVARNTIMNLPVRTRMATELQLAQRFNADPIFELGLDNRPKGCFAEDASVFVREVGWDINRQADEAIKVIYKHVYEYDYDTEKLLDKFERKILDETIKHRQNRVFNKIHRVELNEGDASMQNNPFANPDFCTILKSTDYLPNLPIVYYGKSNDLNEAMLLAKLLELLNILKPYGYTP